MSYDFNIEDDLNIDESYKEVDPTPRPPLPGNYLFTVNNWGFAKKYGTEELQLWKDSNGDPKYPLFELKMVEIVDPMEFARKVGVFQSVATAPQERDGSRVSPSADLLRAFDANGSASNTGEVIAKVTEFLNGGLQFRARLDYIGYDKVFADSQIEAAGGKDNIDKKTLNKIYQSAKVRGYRKIQSQNAGRGGEKLPLHKWVGPSGEILSVKPELTIFYPASDTTVKLGPDKAVLAS